MKKYFLMLGLVGAALSFTNCSKDIEDVVLETPTAKPFELYAPIVVDGTRTINDGLDTKWNHTDGVKVFHADADTKTYVHDGKFVFAGEKDSDIQKQNCANGLFSGLISDPDFNPAEKSYDWYVIHPWRDNLTDLNNPENAIFIVGSKTTTLQDQKGISSMAHICGDTFPVFGKTTTTAGGNNPAIAKMSHLASLVRVQITNDTNEELAITKVVFSTPEGKDIIGRYHLDVLKTGEEAFEPNATTEVSNRATLRVSDATLAANAEGYFYLGIKPVKLSTTDNLTVTVTANGEDYTVTKSLKAETSFNPNKFKTFKMKMSEATKQGKWVKVTEEPEKDGVVNWEGEYLVVWDGDKGKSKIWDLVVSDQVSNQKNMYAIIDPIYNTITAAGTVEQSNDIPLEDLQNYVVKMIPFTNDNGTGYTIELNDGKYINSPYGNATAGMKKQDKKCLSAENISVNDDKTIMILPNNENVALGCHTTVVNSFNYLPKTKIDNTDGKSPDRYYVSLYKWVSAE